MKKLFSGLFAAGFLLGLATSASATLLPEEITIISMYSPGSDFTYEWFSDETTIGGSTKQYLATPDGYITFSLSGSDLTLNFMGFFNAIPNASTQYGNYYGPTSYLFIRSSSEAIIGATIDSESLIIGFLASNVTVGANPAYAPNWAGEGIYINLANGLPIDKLVVSIFTVPEPATVGLFLTGLLLALFVARRRIK